MQMQLGWEKGWEKARLRPAPAVMRERSRAFQGTCLWPHHVPAAVLAAVCSAQQGNLLGPGWGWGWARPFPTLQADWATCELGGT